MKTIAPSSSTSFSRIATALSVASLLAAAIGAALPAAAQTAGTWRPLGPAGGLINALVAPAPGVVVAGSDAGGLWRSANGGASWTAGVPLDVNQQAGGHFYVLAADPADAQTLYADTGTVWKSGDVGSSWSQVFNPGQPVTGLAVSPVNHLRLYALVSGNQAYRSDDGGLDWSPVDEAPLAYPDGIGFSGTLITADPFNADTAYAAGQGLFLTTDAGVHWTPEGGLPGTVEGLVADPAQRGTLYAWVQQNFQNRPKNLWVSHDGGGTWTDLSINFTGQLGGMAVVPRAGATSLLYVAGMLLTQPGTKGFLGVSDDGGSTWSFPLGSFAMTALAVDGADPQQIYVGVARAGVVRSLDGGATWATAQDGMAARRIDSVAVDPFIAQRLYAVTGPAPTNDIVISADAGATWTLVSEQSFAGLDFFPSKVVADPAQSGVIYGIGGLAMVKSVDGGAHWRGAPTPINVAFDLAVNPQRDKTLYLVGLTGGSDGAAGLSFPAAARSADGGATWVGLASRLGLTQNPGDQGSFRAVAVNPRAANTVVIAGEPLSFRSADAGGSWTPLPLTPGITALAFDKQGGGYAANPVTNEVEVSYDGGVIWVPVTLPAGSNPRALAILHPNRVYAGGDGGVFVSTDRGQTWQQLAAGLPVPLPVLSLAVDPRTGVVYAGTAGQGLWSFTPAP